MISVAKIPEHILIDLNERGLSDDDIENSTYQNLFNEYCIWHGLLDWGPSLLLAVDALKKADSSQTT